MNRGIIYRLICPTGKMYYGQTDRTAERRWNEHYKASQKGRLMHLPICIAIREYGWENFTKEIVLECENCELDFYEIKHIKDDNTLVPNGYNVLPGGRHKIDNLPEEYQLFYSQNVRKHITYDLPPGVAEVCLPQRGEYGFKVYIGLTNHDFISKHETMDEKYKAAMNCYNKIKSGEEYQNRPNHHKWDKAFYNELGVDVPEGIKYRKDKDGFEVHVKINDIVYRKTFTKKKFTREQNLKSAIDHLNTLKLYYSQ